MSCTLDQEFTQDCRDSAGGIKSIKVKIFDSTLTGITVTSGVATLAGAALTGWLEYFCEEETAMFEGAGVTSRENGTKVFNQTLTYVNNKLRAAFRNELDKLHQTTLHVVVYENNGNVWLLGYERGVFVSASSSTTGTKLEDRSGYTLTFTGKEKQPIVSVSNAWIALTN